MVGDGTNAVKVMPRVDTLVANSKSNIREAYHGVSDKHLYRYVAEFFIAATAGSGNHICLAESSRHALVKVPFLIQS